MKHSKLFSKLWDHYGKDAQLDILIEEMSELTKAILKARRYKKSVTNKMLEELADVEICAAQLAWHLQGDGLDKMRKCKWERLERLVEGFEE